MNVLAPLISQLSPSRTAAVRIPATSLPVSGSVMAKPKRISPVAMRGSHLRLSSREAFL